MSAMSTSQEKTRYTSNSSSNSKQHLTGYKKVDSHSPPHAFASTNSSYFTSAWESKQNSLSFFFVVSFAMSQAKVELDYNANLQDSQRKLARNR